jgi:O-antigen/teichoic acid export membrane protein
VSKPARHSRAGRSMSPGRGPRRHLHLITRASWNLIDQVLSALTNMVLSVLVVHAAGAKAFDAFSVVFLLFATMIGIERALIGQPLVIRHSTDTGATRRRTVSRATGLVIGITVPASLLMLGAGTALGGTLGSTLIATAIVLPFLIMQDTGRFAFFAAGQSKLAALNDALWAVVQFSAMGLLMLDMSASAWSLVLTWGGAAAVCVAVALVQLRALPNPFASISWIREHSDLVGYLVGEYMLSTGAFNGGYLTVGAIIGDQAVGSIRAAQVLLGPLQIVSGAGMSFGLPEVSRRADQLSSNSLKKIAYAATAAMMVLSVVYIGLLEVMPDVLGRLLFADKWIEAQEVLLPLSLAMLMSTASLGPAIVVYALGLARKSFRLIMIEAPLVFTLMIGGTLLFAVKGAAWGQLIDQTVILLLWYGTLLGVMNSRQYRLPTESTSSTESSLPAEKEEPGIELSRTGSAPSAQ